MKRARRILALLVLAVGLLALLVREDRQAAPGEEQVYDDFGFSVVSVERAGGRWVVGLRVANHARRVPFRLDGFGVRLVDGDGAVHEGLPKPVTPARTELEPGETALRTYVFDLPSDARDAVLAVTFGTIPDALDWLFLGRRTFALPVH